MDGKFLKKALSKFPTLSKNNEIFLEVVATVILITGVGLTSFNIFPMNIYISLIGNFLWLILGICWKKWSLIIIQVVVTIIYIVGMLKYLLI